MPVTGEELFREFKNVTEIPRAQRRRVYATISNIQIIDDLFRDDKLTADVYTSLMQMAKRDFDTSMRISSALASTANATADKKSVRNILSELIIHEDRSRAEGMSGNEGYEAAGFVIYGIRHEVDVKGILRILRSDELSQFVSRKINDPSYRRGKDLSFRELLRG